MVKGKYILALSALLLFRNKSNALDTNTFDPPGTTTTTSSVSNMDAFLATIRYAEGTLNESDPYRVTYGYDHVISDLSNHPAVTGEWTGKVLPNSYCIAANYPIGCKSTAAGAYQILKNTWLGFKGNNPSHIFDKMGQDAAAIYLIVQRGAYNDVLTGDFETAINKCSWEWASLPPGRYGQPQRTMQELRNFYYSQFQIS